MIDDGNLDNRVAIIGSSVRVPGARSVDALWRLVERGAVGLSTISSIESERLGAPRDLARDPKFVGVVGMIEDTEAFDAAYFGISARDASIMDPQHRHFLECVVEALEDAGLNAHALGGSVGVFASSGMNTYLLNNLLPNAALVRDLGMFQLRHTGNDKDFLATEVSYHLNLTGPSINVQTACSSSLVAVHLAAQGLLNGEIDVAIAGGVTIDLPGLGYLYEGDGVQSRDGVCRAFDAESSGTVFSSGAGVVVLKRLVDALKDGDVIQAVICGSAVNNDGSRKVGFLAPSVEGHAAVVVEALAVADVRATDIGYIETHGTGTPVGDPIEFEALSSAFRTGTKAEAYCALGSVKPNIGHVDTAAGVVSLIKAAEVTRRAIVPPLANFVAPNPLLKLDDSPFYLPATSRPWTSARRVAGVSSLGVGGTNAHVILEAPPDPIPVPDRSDRPAIATLVVSAKTPSALEAARCRLAAALRDDPSLALADVASTLLYRREVYPLRSVVSARTREAAIRSLEGPLLLTARADHPRLAFLLPGPGADAARMLASLVEDPSVRRLVTAANDTYERVGVADVCRVLDKVLLGEPVSSTRRPSINLPLLAVAELAVAGILRESGARPDVLIGNSTGELVAACLAGSLGIDDLLELIHLRGVLLEETGVGLSMLSVLGPLEEVTSLLAGSTQVSVVSSPEQCVVSGNGEDLLTFRTRAEERGLSVAEIAFDAAPHSPALDPALERWRAAVASKRWERPEIPWVSNIDGALIEEGARVPAEYWVQQFREPVRLDRGVATVAGGDGSTLYVEVGPGFSLGAAVKQSVDDCVVLSTDVRRGFDETSDGSLVAVRRAIGELWARGTTVRREAVADCTRTVRLPPYAFDRHRHWIDAKPGRLDETAPDAPRLEVLRPSWHELRLRAKHERPLAGSTFLVFDDGIHGSSIEAELHPATVIRIGILGRSEKAGSFDYAVRPELGSDLEELLDRIGTSSRIDGIVNLWPLTVAGDGTEDSMQLHLARSVGSLLSVARSLSPGQGTTLPIVVASSAQQRVLGNEAIDPWASLVLGAVHVLPREQPAMLIRCVDLETQGAKRSDTASQLVRELIDTSVSEPVPVVAIRNGVRFVRTFAPTVTGRSRTSLREDGVYLITGATGALGSALAADLAVPGRKLALMAHSRDEATEMLRGHHFASREAKLRRQSEQLEAAGAEVLALRGDMGTRADVRRVLDETIARFGRIDGIFHLAGVIDDRASAFKTYEAMERVISAKALGACLLAEMTRTLAVDFLVLFSSTSGILGPAGQVDYSGANAVLDGLSAADPDRILSIDWGIWRNLGMSADPEHADHIMLRGSLEASDWQLREHQTVDGHGLLPGSAHLELLVRALRAEEPVDGPEPSFAAPVVVDDFRIESPVFVEHDEAVEFAVRRSGDELQLWSGGTTSSICVISGAAPLDASEAFVDLAALRRQLEPTDVVRTSRASQEQQMVFGDRWSGIGDSWRSENQVLCHVSLAEKFADDLRDHPLHPALVDLGFAAAIALANTTDSSAGSLFVPLSADRIRINGTLPPYLYVLATRRSDLSLPVSWCVADLEYVRPDGVCIVSVEGLTMKAVQLSRLGSEGRERTASPPASVKEVPLQRLGRTLGLTAPEGIGALRLLVESEQRGQVVVTSIPLATVRDALRVHDEPFLTDRALARPELGRAARPPLGSVESSMIEIWQSTLGVTGIGMDDDFFDLGGHSLIAMRLLSRVRESFGARFGLSVLLEAPTPAGLLRAIGPTDSSVDGDVKPTRKPETRFRSVVPIRPEGSRPAIFCVHGAGGSVLNFTGLARSFPPSRPVFGIQAAGTDGRSTPDPTLDAMVDRYLADLEDAYPVGELSFVGYSGGGLIALEIASRLRDSGRVVGPVVLLDTFHPSTSLLNDRGRLVNICRNIRFEGVAPVVKWAFRFTRDRVRSKFGGVSDDSDEYGFVNLEDHFASLMKKYIPRSYSVPTVLVRASEVNATLPPLHGWKPWLGADLATRRAHGGHSTLLDEPNVASLMELIEEVLAIENQPRHSAK